MHLPEPRHQSQTLWNKDAKLDRTLTEQNGVNSKFGTIWSKFVSRTRVLILTWRNIHLPKALLAMRCVLSSICRVSLVLCVCDGLRAHRIIATPKQHIAYSISMSLFADFPKAPTCQGMIWSGECSSPYCFSCFFCRCSGIVSHRTLSSRCRVKRLNLRLLLTTFALLRRPTKPRYVLAWSVCF